MKSSSELGLASVGDNDALYHLLRNDPALADYLNCYLADGSFSPNLHFNSKTGMFEELRLADGMRQVQQERPPLLEKTPPHKEKKDKKGGGKKTASERKHGVTVRSAITSAPKAAPSDPDLEPPEPAINLITKDSYVATLEPGKSATWVREECLPQFKQSAEYIQYTLCRILTSSAGPVPAFDTAKLEAKAPGTPLPEMVTTYTGRDLSDPRLRAVLMRSLRRGGGGNGHDVSDADVQAAERQAQQCCDLSRTQLANVRSMKSFVTFLKDTSGYVCWQFWIKAQKILISDIEEEKGIALKQLQRGCLQAEALVQIPLPQHAMELFRNCVAMSDLLDVTVFLRDLMATNLYHYWVPRYLLHTYLKSARAGSTGPPAPVKLNLSAGGSLFRNQTVLRTTETFDVETVMLGLQNFDSEPEDNGDSEEETSSDAAAQAPHGTKPDYLNYQTNSAAAIKCTLTSEVRAKLVSALENDLATREEMIIPKMQAALGGAIITSKRVRRLVHLWRSIQSYRAHFSVEYFQPEAATLLANEIITKYIMQSGSSFVRLGSKLVEPFVNRFSRFQPYDDLFDGVEEDVMLQLEKAYTAVIDRDEESFRAYVERDPTYTFASSHPEKSQLDILAYDPVIIRSNVESLIQDTAPLHIEEMTFEQVLNNRLELEYFKEFLNEHSAARDLMCWMEIQAYNFIPRRAKQRHIQARNIRYLYMTSDYLYSADGPATKQDKDELLAVAEYNRNDLVGSRPPTKVLKFIQSILRRRLERHWMPKFVSTTKFKRRTQKLESNADSSYLFGLNKMQAVTEDTTKGKKGEIPDVVRARHMRDVSLFRKSLKDNHLAEEFLRYLQIREGKLEKDLLFWIEVQRFKLVCHNHSAKSLVVSKARAIVSVYLTACYPRQVPISVDDELAEQVATRVMGDSKISPYVFHKAQMTVFDVLFPEWIGFSCWRAEKLKQNPNEPLPFEELEEEKLQQKQAEAKILEKLERERATKEKRSQPRVPKFELERDRKAREDAKSTFVYSEYLQMEKEQERLKRTEQEEKERQQQTSGEIRKKPKSRMSSSRSAGNLSTTPMLPAVNTKPLSASQTRLTVPGRMSPAKSARPTISPIPLPSSPLPSPDTTPLPSPVLRGLSATVEAERRAAAPRRRALSEPNPRLQRPPVRPFNRLTASAWQQRADGRRGISVRQQQPPHRATLSAPSPSIDCHLGRNAMLRGRFPGFIETLYAAMKPGTIPESVLVLDSKKLTCPEAVVKVTRTKKASNLHFRLSNQFTLDEVRGN